MTEVLFVLLDLNVIASLGILLALAGRGIVRRFAGAETAYGLWLMVPLLVGVSLLPGLTDNPVPQDWGGAPFLAQGAIEPAIVAAADAGRGTSADPSVQGVIFGIWAAGALISAGLVVIGHARFEHRLGVLKAIAARIVRTRADIGGPVLMGLIRPVLVLPQGFRALFDAEERRLVLAHERVHARRGDPQVNAIMALMQVVFWFNPLVHLAVRLVRVDQELACDAAVLRKHPSQKAQYARALLKTQLAPESTMLACAWPANGAGVLKARVAQIAALRGVVKTRFAGRLGTGLCVCLVAGLVWSLQPASGAEAQRGFDSPRIAALFAAAASGDVDRLAGLFDAGVDPDAALPEGGSALILAAEHGHTDAVRLLLERGADPDRLVRGDGSPLISAAEAGDLEASRLLLDAGARPNRLVAEGDASALTTAARTGDRAIAELLLARGADADLAVDDEGHALMAAVRSGHDDLARRLVEAGADPGRVVRIEYHQDGQIVERRTSARDEARRLGHATLAEYLETDR